jgi:hypothetical protein
MPPPVVWRDGPIRPNSKADAYTVIVLASSGEGEHYAWMFSNPAAAGYFGGRLSDPGDLSRSQIEQWALKRCRLHGGINPRIVLSTGEYGYFAIAVSGVGTEKVTKGESRSALGRIPKWNGWPWGIVGWSGPLPSPEAAAQEAIAKCKERGGTDPRIMGQWHDYYHANEKHI